MVRRKRIYKKTMRVLVTGATGFVGSNITRRLVSEGYETHILLRDTSNTWRIDDVLPGLNRHFVDITDKKKLRKILRGLQPDYIFHLANVGVYGGFEKHPADVMNVNLIGLINLLEASESIDYKCFINTGSSSEYGDKSSTMVENDFCQPQSAYAVSKLTSTLYSQREAWYKEKPIVNLRLFTPFGPFDNTDRLIPYIINGCLRNKKIKLGTPKTVRDYIYIEDVVDAYINIMHIAKKPTGEVINIGSGKQSKTEEIVKKIISLTNTDLEIEWNSKIKPRYESRSWRASIEKAEKLIQWTPKTSLEEGLRKTIEWYRNFYQ